MQFLDAIKALIPDTAKDIRPATAAERVAQLTVLASNESVVDLSKPEHFQRFFARHARWDESDRPSLQSLLIEEEG